MAIPTVVFWGIIIKNKKAPQVSQLVGAEVKLITFGQCY